MQAYVLCHVSIKSSCCRAEGAVALLGDGSARGPWWRDFTDKTAQWIWSMEGAGQDAPVNHIPIQFTKKYNSAMSVPVVIHTYTDNYGRFTLNGVQLGWAYWGWWGESQFETTLQAGNNVLTVDAFNTDGPAGLIVTVINKNTGVVMFNTDSSWTWQVETAVVSEKPSATQPTTTT